MTRAIAVPPISVNLAPGEYFVGDARHRVRTLLGSCVSITLWQPQRRIGAMSHFLLAERVQNKAADSLDARYGVEALALMMRELSELGVAATQCEAKLFGGGDMFPLQQRGRVQRVGRRNGSAAQALVALYGIRLVSQCLFGAGHRKIVFDISTGDVWSRRHDADTEPVPLTASAGDRVFR